MPKLQSGVVTFLFTDIEGSTRLLRELRDGYGKMLAEHQRLLREAFARHDGQEIDTQGDSFFVAFIRGSNAVAAAVDAQRALASNPWPKEVEVNVRMGIHTGQAVAEDDRYTGLAVHRAARICSAGHGGQVLVSQTTRALLEDEGDQPGIALRSLGEQELKDFDRPVPIYQAEAPGLAKEFPPLRKSGELAQAMEAQPAPHSLRRTLVLVASGALLAAAVGLGAFLLFARSGGGVTVLPNSLGVIDPRTDKVVGQVGLPNSPQSIAAGAGGVWVANVSDKTLSHVDPKTRTLGKTIPLGEALPTGVAAGAGAVWVENGLVGKVKRVDPRLDLVLRTIQVVPLSQAGSGGAVTVGDGRVWLAFPVGYVVEIRPSANRDRVVATTYAGRNPSGIALGLGSLWVSNRQDNTVSRFKLAGFSSSTLARKITAGRGPSGVAVGGGAAWVANEEDNAVSRIDPASNSSTTIPVGKKPEGIAYGNGAVWVANSGDGTVSRIDPATRKVETIKVGNSPVGIAAGYGLVWITVQAP